MTMAVLYQKPGRPVWVGPHLGLQDLQGVYPRFWCLSCGTEVFLWGKTYCHRCEKEACRNEKRAESLRGMYPGEQSRRVREQKL